MVKVHFSNSSLVMTLTEWASVSLKYWATMQRNGKRSIRNSFSTTTNTSRQARKAMTSARNSMITGGRKLISIKTIKRSCLEWNRMLPLRVVTVMLVSEWVWNPFRLPTQNLNFSRLAWRLLSSITRSSKSTTLPSNNLLMPARVSCQSKLTMQRSSREICLSSITRSSPSWVRYKTSASL